MIATLPAPEAVAARWAARQNLRIDGVLPDQTAAALLAALRAQPHRPVWAPPDNFAFQYWKHTYVPAGGDALLDAFGRWLHADFVAWVRAWAGRDVQPHPSQEVTATLYSHGSYLDLHNDVGHGRALAFVFGLTPAAWPAEEGGHLEFCAADEDGLVVTERRAPGWGTLDVFAVDGAPVFHQIPILTTRQERRVVSGWLYAGPD